MFCFQISDDLKRFSRLLVEQNDKPAWFFKEETSKSGDMTQLVDLMKDLNLPLAVSREEAFLTKENVLQTAVLASYFPLEPLVDKCCSFVTQFITEKNCIQMLEVAVQLNLNKLKENCTLFIAHQGIVYLDKLSTLPLEMLIEIIGHPAATVRFMADVVSNEIKFFNFLYGKIESLSREEKVKYIPKILKAVHMPVTGQDYLFSVLKGGMGEFWHIPEARDLLIEAGQEIDPLETREWYLERHHDSVEVKFLDAHCLDLLEVSGETVIVCSKCVLISGFPFFIYSSPNRDRYKEIDYYVGSPVAIEKMDLQGKLIVEIDHDDEELPVTTYHNGVVDRRPFHI